jgi:anti-sigma regulatory factor (Ser/Thr protein kinase)
VSGAVDDRSVASRGVPVLDVSLARDALPDEPMTPSDRRRPLQMRRLVRAYLRLWGLDTLMVDTCLLVTELVTNALQHGGASSIGVRMYCTDSLVLLEVVGGGVGLRPTPATLDDERGRGLFLVDAVASAWGVGGDGQSTWCTVALPGAEGKA